MFIYRIPTDLSRTKSSIPEILSPMRMPEFDSHFQLHPYHHAKLHRDWRQAHDEGFHLNYLPPYSPDLNPIERVWKLTRKLCIHDQYFAHLNEVVQAVEAQFEQWKLGHETVRRLCAI